ncbi:MAG: hypothetical protein AAGL17_13800 [Cyanobacteria bacterium J06576_12]
MIVRNELVEGNSTDEDAIAKPLQRWNAKNYYYYSFGGTMPIQPEATT